MRIAVMGANGTLGRALVERATARGHELVAVTRGAPKRTFLKAVHRSADVVTGEGIADAVSGADVVINAVNAERDLRAVLVDGTRRLIEACKAAGVPHFVAISMVGVDRVPLAYNMVKVAEEAVVAQAPVGWSLLRATHFHDRIDAMFTKSSSFGVVLAAPGVKMQPICTCEVANALVEAAEAGPRQRLPDIGGPEVLLMRELARQWLVATKKTRLIMPAPVFGKLASRLQAGELCVPERAVGKRTFLEWATERYGH